MTGNMMENQALINHLNEISTLFLKIGEHWKATAFIKASAEIESMDVQIPLVDGKLLIKIPGVGKAIKDVIEEFNATGTSRKLEKLKSMVSEAPINRLNSDVVKYAVKELFWPVHGKLDWDFAGSIRRGSETCKDVDIVVCLHNEQKDRKLVADILKNAELIADVRNGQEKIGVSFFIKQLDRFITLDINFTTPDKRGAMYLYLTGPKSFNIKQRGIAKRKGMKLNQNGLFTGDVLISSESEESIFDSLGMKFISPSNRK